MNVSMKPVRNIMSCEGLGKRSWSLALGRFITVQEGEPETKKVKAAALAKMESMEQKWGQDPAFVEYKNTIKKQISGRVAEMNSVWAKEEKKEREEAEEKIQALNKEIAERQAEKVELMKENALPKLVSKMVVTYLRK